MTASLLASTIPVEVFVRDRRCVVVGGGHEAKSKVLRLLASGARVEWFDDEPSSEATDPRVIRLAGPPALEDDAAVVFLATSFEDPGWAAAVAPEEHAGLHPRPEHATFVNPAVEGSGLHCWDLAGARGGREAGQLLRAGGLAGWFARRGCGGSASATRRRASARGDCATAGGGSDKLARMRRESDTWLGRLVASRYRLIARLGRATWPTCIWRATSSSID
jgi:hypothetical protein